MINLIFSIYVLNPKYQHWLIIWIITFCTHSMGNNFSKRTFILLQIILVFCDKNTFCSIFLLSMLWCDVKCLSWEMRLARVSQWSCSTNCHLSFQKDKTQKKKMFQIEKWKKPKTICFKRFTWFSANDNQIKGPMNRNL